MGILELFDMNDKVVIITGGARGLGFGMAKGLGEAGATIIIADYDIEGSEKAVSELKSIGIKARAFKLDVTDREVCEKTVNKVIEKFGKIDVLINNAGINCHVKFEDMTDEEWHRVLAVNLGGVFNMCQFVGKQMLKQQKGSIINIASMNGIVATYPQTISSYNTSKAGVIMLTKSLAIEWAEKGIRVNAIAPGFVETELTKKKWHDPNSEFVKSMLIRVPMRRRGTIDEIAPLALFLASEASSYATGAVYVIDGGYTAI